MVRVIVLIIIWIGFTESLFSGVLDEYSQYKNQHHNNPNIIISSKISIDSKSCYSGDADACFKLGLLYEDKRKSYKEAAKYYQKTCDLGDGLGCVFFGVLIEEGKGFKSSYIKAKEYYKKACDFGEASGCSIVGFFYEKGKGFESSYIKAKEYYKKACELGFSSGCADYKRIKNIKTATEIESVKDYSIKAYVVDVIKHGSSGHDYAMGAMPGGMAVGTDVEEIAEYVASGMKIEKPSSFAACEACHGANGKGMRDLTPSLLNLNGTNKNRHSSTSGSKNKDIDFQPSSSQTKINIRKANTNSTDTLASKIKAYKNNCLKGDMASCYQIGTTYDGTNGPKYNLDLAKQFFDLSCEGGYHRACGALAGVYMTKKFRDYKKAQHFAKIACDKEQENGCMVLGRMYNNDDYPKRDQVLAKQYFSKALKYSLKNCTQSIGSACNDAAWLYSTDVLEVKDKEKAKQFYTKACILDSLDGCMSMAHYMKELKDMKKAVEFYRKVCERHGQECSYLAYLYEYGNGNLESDPDLAKKYYRKACELGEEMGCVGIRYIDLINYTKGLK